MELSGSVAPDYAVAANEDYHIESLSRGQRERLCQRWLGLEPALRLVLASNGSNDLFLLLAKGKWLFEELGVQSNQSFSELLEKW